MINKYRSTMHAISWVFSLVLFSPQVLYALPAPGADIVSLKQDCGADPNCFTDSTALTDWLWQTRVPSASDPVLVDIGPGTYGSFNCPFAAPRNGYVTLRGSGRDNTVLKGGLGGISSMKIRSCKKLVVQDLTIVGSPYGVIWDAGGSSSWINVDIDATAAAWYDSNGGGTICGSFAGTHYWWSSKLETRGSTSSTPAFRSACGNHWFYGSEILLKVDKNTGGAFISGSSIDVFGPSSRVQLFGSAVRALVTADSPADGNLTGLWAGNGAKVHMHGGIVSVQNNKSTSTSSVLGAGAGGTGALAHTLDTAFNVSSAGTGQVSRVGGVSGGNVDSPFQWAAGVAPPTDGSGSDINSITGEDMFVETDCGSTGCQTTGTETHLMIYNETCTTDGPWFDVVVGKCRGL